MLKKLSVITGGYSVNADIQGKDVAIINLQSFKMNGKDDVAEIVATYEEIQEIIQMLRHTSDSLLE